MELREERICAAGTPCRILSRGTGPCPTLYWAVMQDQLEAVRATAEALGPQRAFRLVAWGTNRWNYDLTPWASDCLPESGGGEARLSWLLHDLLPAIEGRSDFTPGPRILCGYSLGGLFSLWAFYRTGAFQGAGSASGSLWYPGWAAFAEGRTAPAGTAVYLSLGDHEERTRNPLMAPVGEATRKLHAELASDPQVRTTLEWNPGGHFKDCEARMVRAMDWLLEQFGGEEGSVNGERQ